MSLPENTSALISCVLPTYNRADSFLENCISNILNQTYPHLELIIVNDGSEDNTKDLVYGIRDKRIKYIELPKNSGSVSIPRNIGISHSSGKYIAHTDDDSPWTANKLEIMLPLLEYSENYTVAYGDRIQNNSIISIPEYIPSGPGIDTSQFIYRSNVYERIPLVFARRACDYYLLKKIWDIFPYSFVHINKPVCEYIWHKFNRSHDVSTLHRIIYPGNYTEFFKKDTKFIYKSDPI